MACAVERIFLLDYTCVHPFGHNAPSLQIFGEYLSGIAPVTILVPVTFGGEFGGFQKCLASPLRGYFKLNRAIHVAGQRISTENLYRAAFKIRNRLERRIKGREVVEVEVLRNVAELDHRFQFTASDLLVLPSSDMYGPRGLISYFESLPPARRPRLHFRLIGVMETHSYSYATPLDELIASVRHGRDCGLQVQLSCETPAYLSLIRAHIWDAFLFPYPLRQLGAGRPDREQLTIAFPGQGRIDKGYDRICNIARLVRERGRNVRWLVHSMRATDRHYSAAYQDRLTSEPSIEVTKADLSTAEMSAFYERADFSVLPYAPDTYRLRGSAVLQEALAHGHLCVVPAGTGIASMAEVVGNGICADSDEDFAACIVELTDMPWMERRARVAAAQQRYDRLVLDCMARIFA